MKSCLHQHCNDMIALYNLITQYRFKPHSFDHFLLLNLQTSHEPDDVTGTASVGADRLKHLSMEEEVQLRLIRMTSIAEALKVQRVNDIDLIYINLYRFIFSLR